MSKINKNKMNNTDKPPEQLFFTFYVKRQIVNILGCVGNI